MALALTYIEVGTEEASSFQGRFHGLDLRHGITDEDGTAHGLHLLIHEFGGLEEGRDVHGTYPKRLGGIARGKLLPFNEPVAAWLEEVATCIPDVHAIVPTAIGVRVAQFIDFETGRALHPANTLAILVDDPSLHGEEGTEGSRGHGSDYKRHFVKARGIFVVAKCFSLL